MAHLKRPWMMAVVAMAALLMVRPAVALESDLEYAVKAQYLVRFAAFVEWPPDAFDGPRSPLYICIVGRDPFGALLDRAMRGQVISGRTLAARRLARVDGRSDCHMVYVGKLAGQSVPQIESLLATSPVLVVTDSANGADRGQIHFAIDQNRVRFHVDDAAAKKAGLTISSRLLSLALSVTQGSGS